MGAPGLQGQTRAVSAGDNVGTDFIQPFDDGFVGSQGAVGYVLRAQKLHSMNKNTSRKRTPVPFRLHRALPTAYSRGPHAILSAIADPEKFQQSPSFGPFPVPPAVIASSVANTGWGGEWRPHVLLA